MSDKKATCNICGGDKFKLGPGGRLSITNLPPVCESCGSLERHRIIRAVFEKIRNADFKKLSALVFTKEPVVAGGWFKSVRYSVSGAPDAVDVQKISLPDRSVDVVVCSHVLTAVERYEDAFREIARVTSDRGFALVSFANPHYRKVTEDWGSPDPKRHKQYRIFGSDIEQKISSIIPSAGILRVSERDPVTEVEDRAYLISRDIGLLETFADVGWAIRFLHF